MDVVVDPADFEGITDEDAAAVGKVCKQNIKALRGYIGRELRPGHRRMVFRFLTSPVEIKGDGKVEHIVSVGQEPEGLLLGQNLFHSQFPCTRWRRRARARVSRTFPTTGCARLCRPP